MDRKNSRLKGCRLLTALASCLLCILSAYGSDYHDDVFKYALYYDDPDGTPAVVVDGIYQFPSDGILNLPAYISCDGTRFRVVGWDGQTYVGNEGPCKKLILPETFRELGVTVDNGYKYNILNDLIKLGLKEIEVNPNNQWFKSQDGMLLSKDGKTLYYISDALAAAPDLVIPEGIEYIRVIGVSDGSYDHYLRYYRDTRRSIVLPASLKFTDEIYAFYRFIILKSETAPESIKSYMFGSDPESKYSDFKDATRMIYVPVGSIDSYRFSTIWGYANSIGYVKEIDMTSDKNVEFNFKFSKRWKPTITVNNETATDLYTARPLEPVTLEIKSCGELDYFNDSNLPGATCTIEYLENDWMKYTYEFIPDKNCVISAGQSLQYGNGQLACALTYDGVKLTNYYVDGNEENLVIPSTITLESTTYDVTELGYRLFADKDIRRVTLPSSLKRIGAGCFSNANLQEIDLPEGLEEIGEYAFSDNKSLHYITLPASITKLNYDAFAGCDLKSCNIPGGFRGYGRSIYIDDPFFNNAGGEDGFIDLITIEASKEPLGISVAPAKRLVVNRPWNPYCIEACELVYDADEVILDVNAMRHGNTENLNRIIIKGKECHISGKINKGILPGFILGKFNLKDIQIEASSIKMESGAFADCPSLSKVEVKADGGEGLGESVFEHCRALTHVSLSGIDGGMMTAAFRDCDKLESIDVNGGVDYINGIAFERCSSLKRVEFEYSETPVMIGIGAFDDCPVEEIYLDRSIVDPEPTFFRAENLKRLEIGSNITRIPDYAFAECNNLREIYCESATPPTIGFNTFRNVPTDECRVYVKGGDGEYREAGGWKEFFPADGVNEIEDSTISVTAAGGILTVRGAEGRRLAVYSVSGIRAFLTKCASDTETISPGAGIYIVVAGNETIKINLK